MAGSPLIEFIDPEEEIIPYVGLPKLFPMAQPQLPPEDCLAEFNCKLYWWKNDEWKSRCQGILRFLKLKQEPFSVRIIMLQEATFFQRLNFLVKQEGNMCKLVKSQFKEFGYEWNCQQEGQDEHYLVKLKEQEMVPFENWFNQAIECNQDKEE